MTKLVMLVNRVYDLPGPQPDDAYDRVRREILEDCWRGGSAPTWTAHWPEIRALARARRELR